MQPSRISEFSVQAFATGLLVALIGFSSSFAIVLQGLRASGASGPQAASGLMALSIAMGLSGIFLSATRRMPISVAWSTPGAALLISSGHTLPHFGYAVGAFITCACLLILCGWYRPFGRLIETIPDSLANAMLAGILMIICLAPVQAVAFDATVALPVVVTWLVVGQFWRLWSLPAAFFVLLAIVFWRDGLPADIGEQMLSALQPPLQFVQPSFSTSSIAGIALPLFVVTMASQNIPGVAVQRANGYTPAVAPMLLNTGAFSLLSAPFGGHAVNLAAITAALCAGPDAHADRHRRYWAAIVAGCAYVLLGLSAGLIVLLLVLVPPIMIEAIAGLALISALVSALVSAFAQQAHRDAAAITFVMSASGISLAGIGGAFWGLLCGGIILLVKNRSLNRY